MMKQIGFFTAVLSVLMLSGCGRVSQPALPKGSFYPHTYIVDETPLKDQKDAADEIAGEENLTPEEAQKAADDYAKSIYD